MKNVSNAIDPSLYLSTHQAAKRKTGTDVLGKDDFLKILMVQLQNQDPSSPMEDKDFIAQMAQFSSLEQMTNMTNTLERFIQSQEQNKLIAYNEFVGKEISWHKVSASKDDKADIEIEEGSGKVVSLQFKDNNVYFILEDGTVLEPGNVSQINEMSTENQMLQASMLIGKTVTYLDDNKQEQRAEVKSVSFKNGKTMYHLGDENGTKIVSSQITKIE